MAVGCVITCTPSGKIIGRRPCWPWPAPGVYPRETREGTIEQFFPHNYFRFHLGHYVSPWPFTPYFPKELSMKTLKSSVPITLHNLTYTCDILLSMYVCNRSPAIILRGSEGSAYEGESITTASVNLKDSLPPSMFAAKTWSENEGLWSQLLPLKDEKGLPLFIPTSHSVPCGFTTAHLVYLGPTAVEAFTTLLQESNHG